jgi:WD40 repeat protein
VRIERSQRAELMARWLVHQDPGLQYPALVLGMRAAWPDLVTRKFTFACWQGLAHVVAQMHASRVLLAGAKLPLGTAALDAEGRLLAVDAGERRVHVYDLRRDRLLHRIKIPDGSLRSLQFSADGTRLIGFGYERDCLWSAKSGQLEQVITSADPILAYSASAQRFIVEGKDGTLRIRTIQGTSDKLLTRTKQRNERAESRAAFSRDGRRVLIGLADRSAELWDVESGRLVHKLYGQSQDLSAVAISPDGQQLATASDDAIWIYSAATGQRTYVLSELFSAPSALAFSADGRRLLAVSDFEYLVRIIDTRTHGLQAAIPVYAGPRRKTLRHNLRSAALSADGNELDCRIYRMSSRRET